MKLDAFQTTIMSQLLCDVDKCSFFASVAGCESGLAIQEE
jgi:hypothetical protein